jgi:hypothetical protein
MQILEDLGVPFFEEGWHKLSDAKAKESADQLLCYKA